MKIISCLFIIIIITYGCSSNKNYLGSARDRADLEKTNDGIHKAFQNGDVPAIESYHHPNVIKAFSYNNYLFGRDTVASGLTETLKANKLEFVENKVENILIQGRTAVQQCLFTIKITPKNGDKPFLYKGRSIVVYVRYKKSPTGWASIREVVQNAP
jgi:ketosteroid isomerase-like protein